MNCSNEETFKEAAVVLIKCRNEKIFRKVGSYNCFNESLYDKKKIFILFL